MNLYSRCVALVVLFMLVFMAVSMYVLMIVVVVISMRLFLVSITVCVVAINDMRRHEVMTYARKHLYAENSSKEACDQDPRCDF